MDAHTSILILGASLLVWGMGVAAVVVPVSAAAYDGLPSTAVPSATSVITTVQTIGASRRRGGTGFRGHVLVGARSRRADAGPRAASPAATRRGLMNAYPV